MLRIFPYIVCDIPHYIREDTRLCYDMPIMVIEDAYNYYLTFIFLKTFTTLYFSNLP